MWASQTTEPGHFLDCLHEVGKLELDGDVGLWGRPGEGIGPPADEMRVAPQKLGDLGDKRG